MNLCENQAPPKFKCYTVLTAIQIILHCTMHYFCNYEFRDSEKVTCTFSMFSNTGEKSASKGGVVQSYPTSQQVLASTSGSSKF